MSKIKIEGVAKIIAPDGDEIEYPFEADAIDGAIAELGRIERHINAKIAEAENRFKDEEI
mgnify:CR=1 FL=1